MRVNLLNYKELAQGKISLGDNKLQAYTNKKEVEASMQRNDTPKDLKIIEDIRLISFGHFQILEKIITSKLDYIDLVKMIAPYLIRPIKEGILDNENKEIEEAHVDKVLNLDVGIVFKAFEDYLLVRDVFIYKTYNGVLYKASEEEEEKDKEEETEETSTDTSLTARALYDSKFFWHKLTMFIAGDFWHEQDALDSLMGRVIIHLAEDRNKQIVENLEHKASLNR